jgi:beta-RFAP synthase
VIRVSAPSRLHFGPFSLPAGEGPLAPWPDLEGDSILPARAFGGVGLMVERPAVTVAAEPAKAWTATGPFGERVLAYGRQVCQALRIDQAFRLAVEGAPPAHVGLGTGTQLALATARAVVLAAGQPEPGAADLARHVGRGRRSALGAHGFAHGGFLVEAGKRSDEALAPLVARAAFPPDWHVLLIIPPGLQGDHGPREADAFRHLAGTPADLGRTEALCRLTLLGMLPALAERDLDAFGEALYDFNRRAGELFRPWQGGLYAHPRVAALVNRLRSEAGLRGVGQSSWGPAVFAVAEPDRATWLAARLAREAGHAAGEVVVTAAANDGARSTGMPRAAGPGNAAAGG